MHIIQATVGHASGRMSEVFALNSLGAATLVSFLAFFGLALPAVWSRKAFRRRAAVEVLRLVLDFFRLLIRP